MNKLDQFGQDLDIKIRRDHGKNFLWAPRLWVCRQYEPILGNVAKIDEGK